MLHHVEGVVIRAMDYKDNDKIITILSRQSGKVSFVAHGVKKVNNKNGAACQPFTRAQFSFYRNRGMGTLRQAEVMQSFHLIRANLELATVAAYLVELVDLMTEEQANDNLDETLYEALLFGLGSIEGEQQSDFILRLFELRLLTELGYAPQFRSCTSCGAEQGEFVLSPAAGGVVCQRCEHRDPSARFISDKLRSLLYRMQQIHIPALGAVELSDQTHSELRSRIRSVVDYHVEHQWKARAFLDQWRSLNG